MKNKKLLLLFVSSLFFSCTTVAYPVDIQVVINENKPVWIGGPIQVKCYFINRTKRSVSLPDPNNLSQLCFYMKREQDTAWQMMSRNRLLDYGTVMHIISPRDSFWMQDQLPTRMLSPATKYILRAVYFTKPDDRNEFNSLDPEKQCCKFVYADFNFVTDSLPFIEKQVYKEVTTKKIEKYFIESAGPIMEGDKDMIEKILNVISNFPQSRLCSYAKQSYFLNIYHRKKLNQSLQPSETDLAKQYGQELLNLKYFDQKKSIQWQLREFEKKE